MTLMRRVVALGGGADLPALMRGIAEAFCLPDRLRHIDLAGRDEGTQRVGRLTLDDLTGDSECAVEPVGEPAAREAIATADLIVLGPGSVRTNLLPVLRVKEIAEAIGRSKARVVLVMSLMTEPGGMDGYVASDCVRAIRRHAPEVPIHDVILNTTPIRSEWVVSSARRGALPIGYDTEALHALGCRTLKDDLLGDGPMVRHDPRKLGRAILGLVADLHTTARISASPVRQALPHAHSAAAL